MTDDEAEDIKAEWWARLAAKPTYVLHDEAVAFAAEMRASDHSRWLEWLDAMSVRTLTDMGRSWAHMTRSLHGTRPLNGKERTRKAWGEARKAGDPFGHPYWFEDGDGNRVWKKAGDMTGVEHLVVAADYQSRGQRNLWYAAKHRAVGRICGNRRVADVMTVEEYALIFEGTPGVVDAGDELAS